MRGEGVVKNMKEESEVRGAREEAREWVGWVDVL